MTKRSKKIRGMDKIILLLIIVIVIVGIIMVYSASYVRAYYIYGSMQRFLKSNIIYAILGFFVMFIVSRIPYKFYRNNIVMRIMQGITIILLLWVILFGKNINGSTRWIYLGTMSFQPSEIAKIVCIMYMAKAASSPNLDMKRFPQFIAIWGFPAICLFLITRQPHISTTMTIFVVMTSLLFIAGMPLINFGLLMMGGAGLFVILVAVSDYAKSRILGIINPSEVASDAASQVLNSLYAISSGGVLGKGLGKSTQKYLYLSESYNDFIFSIYAEELGFVGSVILIMLFFVLIIKCLNLSKNAPDRFSSLVVVGITAQLAFQFLVNIGVAISIFPTTGVPLPFVSYGGSSLVMTLGSMGILLNISRYDRSIRKEIADKIAI